jgi:hypothetical protein
MSSPQHPAAGEPEDTPWHPHRNPAVQETWAAYTAAYDAAERAAAAAGTPPRYPGTYQHNGGARPAERARDYAYCLYLNALDAALAGTGTEPEAGQ